MEGVLRRDEARSVRSRSCLTLTHLRSCLARCPQIPCTYNGATQCFSQQQCLVLGGTPLVYPCNNHGTPRADGTCECTVDAVTGVGYGQDDLVYDHDNCYAQLDCPTDPSCVGRPCCEVDACAGPGPWLSPPNDPFMVGQVSHFPTDRRAHVTDVAGVAGVDIRPARRAGRRHLQRYAHWVDRRLLHPGLFVGV